MKFKAVFLWLVLLAATPLAAPAQQTDTTGAAPTGRPGATTGVDLGPRIEKPEDEMSISGMFLGIIGMVGGAVAGGVYASGRCEDSADDD